MTLVEMEVRALSILKHLKVRVIVIDEVHNLLAGSPREQRVILQLFRHLSNELKASLVCLGIADAREAIAGDTQLSRRLDQMALPRWKADDEFQGLVVAILRSLPLRRPSALSAQSLRTLTRATDGITAKVFGMLNELAVEAVRSGRSKSPTRMLRAGNQHLNERPSSPERVRFSVSIGTEARFQSQLRPKNIRDNLQSHFETEIDTRRNTKMSIESPTAPDLAPRRTNSLPPREVVCSEPRHGLNRPEFCSSARTQACWPP